MKFHTHQLAKGPVDFVVQCCPEDIQLNDADIQFVGEVNGTIHFTLVDTGRVLARGNVKAMMRFECVRCLEAAMQTLSGDIMAVYEAKSEPISEHDPFDDPADHAMVSFNGDTIDPSAQIREALMLAVSDFPVCRPDCKGLCPTCGANLNVGPCRCQQTAQALPGWKSVLQKIYLDES
jgi:uncharacterized protein